MTRNKTLRAATAAISILFGAGTASAAVIDLGFVLDGSGSVSSYDFDSATAALSAALSQIPTSGDNQYRVAVTSYGYSSYTVVPPTVVTAANIASIQSAVLTAYKDDGGTDTAGAITYITDLFLDEGLGDTTLINTTTDGSPNSQYLTESAALAANTAGVDGISLEAVGSGVSSPYALSNMARIAGLGTSGDADDGVIAADLGNLPNATETGFVIPVADFDAYGAAIEAKIGQVIDDTGGNTGVVPLPAAMPMLLAGLGVFGFVRRRQTTT
ncbi:VWA domain-containing protein [Rhodovulum sp. YEN HP10]|uniref:VWA domain-containing protein n=1 Tax=Rhodovulum sp. HP10 TaxID=3387397 RepID=UPI0039E10E84